MTTVKTLRDDIFSISLIGKPNVGKSTLFNKFTLGQNALVHKTPGLTRDRKEIITNILGIPIRVIDTAGVEASLDEDSRSKQLKQHMIYQTSQALIYADLTLFIVDAKEGITKDDLFLSQWIKQKITQKNKQLNQKLLENNNQKSVGKKQNKRNPKNQDKQNSSSSSQNNSSNHDKNNKNNNSKANNSSNNSNSSNESENNNENGETSEMNLTLQQIEQKKSQQNANLIYENIILVANKCEDNDRSIEIQNDLYKLGFGPAIHISAEHGDGLSDLLAKIMKMIPLSYYENFENKKNKRVQKYEMLKKKLVREIKQLQRQGKISEDLNPTELENELDIFHTDPQYNSDFDSENEDNVIEYIDSFKNDLVSETRSKLKLKEKDDFLKLKTQDQQKNKQSENQKNQKQDDQQPKQTTSEQKQEETQKQNENEEQKKQQKESQKEKRKENKQTSKQKDEDDAENEDDDDDDNDDDDKMDDEELEKRQKEKTYKLDSKLSNYFIRRKPIQLSVIGRQNSGKSSFINALLKEERLICDDLPGTTRDAISVQWIYKNKKIILVDTAGIDRSMKQKSDLEKLFYEDTMKAIKFSHIVIVMIDAFKAFQIPELSLAQYVAQEGRGIILVVNKWDLIPDQYKRKAIKYMERQLKIKLGEVKDAKLICISAKTGLNMDKVMDEVLRLYEKWNLRVGTGLLNDWVRKFRKLMKPPTDQGEILNVKFAMQISTRPPTFTVFVNDHDLFTENYYRFMRQSLAREFGLEGIPLRVNIRDPKSQSKLIEDRMKQQEARAKNKDPQQILDTQRIIRNIIHEQRKKAYKAEQKMYIINKALQQVQAKKLSN